MSKLTPKFVKDSTTPGAYQDGRGLILRIAESGRKSWVFRYSFHGERHDISLGSYPALSLRDARLAADAERVTISQGINPLEKRQALRAKTVASKKAGKTLKIEAKLYVKTHSASWSPAYAHDWQSSLENHVYPAIGALHPRDVTTDHVLSVLEPIWLKIPTTAKLVRNRIELVLDAAKAKGLRDGENPARWRGHLDKLLPRQAKPKRAFPAYPWQRISDLLSELTTLDGSAARAMEMVILTACRSGEVRKAKWHEFDYEARIWTIPGERMKSGVTHRVPLTDAMIAVLDSMKGVDPVWVFKQARGPGPLPANALSRVLKSLHVSDCVPHGFRSTFRTWAAEATDFPREVCEMALAHGLKDRVEAAYNRAELIQKRRQLMQQWSDYVLQIGQQQDAA